MSGYDLLARSARVAYRLGAFALFTVVFIAAFERQQEQRS